MSNTGLTGNQRAASTIIILCVITVVAVVFVHKESVVGDVQESGAWKEGADWNENESVDLELQASRVVHQKPPSKRRTAHPATQPQLEPVQEEILLQDLDRHGGKEGGGTEHEDAVYDPPINDTVTPDHADLSTATVATYSSSGFDAQAVAEATKVAAKLLSQGANEADAYKEAQKAAQKKVASRAAENDDSPAFSRTIKAAAYAAEQKAMKLLENGESAEEAAKAAKDAATNLVVDDRHVNQAVPVANGLLRLINTVSHLWEKMEGKVGELSEELKKMPAEGCHDDAVKAASAHHASKIALIQASQHIAKSHRYHEAMEDELMQAEAHESHSQLLRQAHQGHVRRMQKQVSVNKNLADQSKMKSAVHHEHAKKQVHLAQGFLNLAEKHRVAATDAALRCKAQHIRDTFEYAETAVDQYDHQKRKAAMSVAEKKEKAREKAEAARREKVDKQIAKHEKKEKAKEKSRKAAKEKDVKSKEKGVKAQEKAIKNRKYDPEKISKMYTKNSRHHLGDNMKYQQMIVTMQTNLPVQTSAAVHHALRAVHGDEAVLSAAADQAYTKALKVAAKALAKHMAKLPANSKLSGTDLMKKAIITVLKAGRPLQSTIVQTAVKETVDRNLKSTLQKAHRLQQGDSVASQQDLAKVVAQATTKAAKEAQRRVAEAGGTVQEQLQAAKTAAATASKMAAAAFSKPAPAPAPAIRKAVPPKVVQPELLSTNKKVKLEESAKAVVMGNREPLSLLQVTATKALKKLANGKKHSVKVMHATVKKALRPVLTKGISKSVSYAAHLASKDAKKRGMGPKASRIHVLRAAKVAARQAKAQGLRMARAAVKRAVATLDE